MTLQQMDSYKMILMNYTMKTMAWYCQKFYRFSSKKLNPSVIISEHSNIDPNRKSLSCQLNSLSEKKSYWPVNEWHVIALAHAHIHQYLFRRAIVTRTILYKTS